MSIGLVTAILFIFLALLLLSGLPLAFGLGATAVLLALWRMGPEALFLLTTTAFSSWTLYILVALPLFVLMANFLSRSGIADDLYEMMYHWMGSLRGGLAMGTVIICALFAAMSGVSAAGTVTMGLVALPSMLRRNYHKDIAPGRNLCRRFPGNSDSSQHHHDRVCQPHRCLGGEIVHGRGHSRSRHRCSFCHLHWNQDSVPTSSRPLDSRRGEDLLGPETQARPGGYFPGSAGPAGAGNHLHGNHHPHGSLGNRSFRSSNLHHRQEALFLGDVSGSNPGGFQTLGHGGLDRVRRKSLLPYLCGNRSRQLHSWHDLRT